MLSHKIFRDKCFVLPRVSHDKLLTQTCKKPGEKTEGEEAKTRDLRNVKLYTSLPRRRPHLNIVACIFLFFLFVLLETVTQQIVSVNRKVSCDNSPCEDNDKHKLLPLDTWHLSHLSPSPPNHSVCYGTSCTSTKSVYGNCLRKYRYFQQKCCWI